MKATTVDGQLASMTKHIITLDQNKKQTNNQNTKKKQ